MSARAEVIARRLTADGIAVWLWSDGVLSGRHGFALSGVPLTPSPLAVGWMLLGDVALYDAAEVGALLHAARRTVARGGTPGDMRAAVAEALRPKIAPRWEVYQADRNGRPTIRVWRLPRMRWPGLAVWDHVSVGARGARYELLTVDAKGVATGTGLRFSSQRDLFAHLLSRAS